MPEKYTLVKNRWAAELKNIINKTNGVISLDTFAMMFPTSKKY